MDWCRLPLVRQISRMRLGVTAKVWRQNFANMLAVTTIINLEVCRKLYGHHWTILIWMNTKNTYMHALDPGDHKQSPWHHPSPLPWTKYWIVRMLAHFSTDNVFVTNLPDWMWTNAHFPFPFIWDYWILSDDFCIFTNMILLIHWITKQTDWEL